MGIVLLALVPLMALAGPVDETEARQQAKAFLAERGIAKAGTLERLQAAQPTTKHRASGTNATSYYVFNIGQADGFVIVSGDDRTPAILGYADSGSLNMEALPDGLRYLLDGYEEQMEWMDKNGIDGNQAAGQASGTVTRRSAARTAISPLIKTRWDQGTPYNAYCPPIDNEATVTGCVATSMAQVMYYHKWPNGDTPYVPPYETKTKDKSNANITLQVDGIAAESFSQAPTTSFGWGYMTYTYDTYQGTEAKIAVAKLMRYCGQSIQMSYGLQANGGSSAYNEAIPSALKTYFDYDGGVRNTYRKNYSYGEWVSLIYSELAENRPVILGGQSMGGGHSFICDGYDTDDYFHINWGWSGSSDGFFRLSVLQPWSQGIGGSSTLDGFSFSQNAIIGIQPPVSGNKDYCLSLEGLHLSDPSITSQTFTRDEGTNNFIGINIYYLLYSYQYGSNAFDYALQLVDENGNVIQTYDIANNKTLVFNESDYNTKSITIPANPANLGNGTYYIKAMSKPHNATNWLECYDGDRYQLTAVISGDELTITVPIADTVFPTGATETITVTGDLTQGHEQEVTASVIGGAKDYHGNLFLGAKLGNDGANKAVMGKTVDIPAGKTVDVHFSFIPESAGNYTLSLYTGKDGGNVSGTKIGTETQISITASDATDNLDLTFDEPTIINLTGTNELYGKALRATVRVTNPSTTNSYAGQLDCTVKKWTFTTTDNGNGSYTTYISSEEIGTKKYKLMVDKNSSTTINIARDDLELTDDNTRYSVHLTYKKAGSMIDTGKDMGLDGNGYGALTVSEGFRIGNATGVTTICPISKSNINAGNACFVDLRDLPSLSDYTISKSTNSNCIYLLPEGTSSIPTSLSDCNVVIGNTAPSLKLQDGADFYSPISFTATSASYTRIFTDAAAGTSGWSSLFLPFTVTSITCEDLGTVNWFHNSTDEGKNFWLRSFTADGESSVTFDYAQEIAANTPYIIAVPGEDFGAWKMTGKAVTFSGTNVSIVPTGTSSASGDHYKFCGSSVGSSLKDVYMLNNSGSKFVKKTTSTAVPAFRGWFSPVSISSLSHTSLSIVGPETTGIKTIGNDENAGNGTDRWYSIDGRRLTAAPSAPGIYINNGKKIVIK